MKSHIGKCSIAFTTFIVLTGCASINNQAEVQTTEAAAILDQWTGKNNEVLIQAYKKLVIAKKAYEKAKANDIEEPISFIASSCSGYQTWYNFGQTASRATKQGYDFNKQAIETFKIQANHPEQMQQYFESSQ